jgi:hypothetical protein
MTIAKNFVTQGLWAVNGLQFVSATSSPLWSMIISGVYFVTGVDSVTPFVLNIFFAVAVIYVVYKILDKFNAGNHVFLVLLVFILVSPLPALVFTGMEHIAQILFALLFVYSAANYVINGNKFRGLIPLIVISAILTVLRYEDLFLVFSVSLIFTLRKKYTAALLVLAAGILPVLVYGYISESHGWMFLPNPVLIKSKMPDPASVEIVKIPFRAFKRMLEPDILFLVPPVIFVFLKTYRISIKDWNGKQLMFFIFLITYILHMIFAQTGWFFRYEAYLVSIGIVVLWLNIYDYFPFKNYTNSGWLTKLKPALYVIIVLSLAGRSVSSFLVPQSANNIYNQHYQMAMFLNSLPVETVIAANDIGMLNYYTENKIVDLWGLADIDVARSKLSKNYNTNSIDEITDKKNVDLAIVYAPWFDQFGGLPSSWQKIGEWQMTRLNIVCGNETVSFYVLNNNELVNFKEKVHSYSINLPKSIKFKTY